MAWPPPRIWLTQRRRRELTKLAAQTSAPHGLVQGARMILRLASGHSPATIARALGVTDRCVRKSPPESTMPKLASTDSDLAVAEAFLKQRRLKHLRVKKRADSLTLDAGSSDDPWPRARFRLLAKQRWTLDIADAAGQWEATPSQAPFAELLALLADRFPWVLSDL
jgi:hypothetical protein